MYEQRGDVVEAFSDFEDALKKHPTNPVRSKRIFFKKYSHEPRVRSKLLLVFQDYLQLQMRRGKNKKQKC
jgi:hypothetical protein